MKTSTLRPLQHVVENCITKGRDDKNITKYIVTVLIKISCRCMLQIITVTLMLDRKFLMMVILSDALVVNKGRIHSAEKPDGAGSS